MRKIIPLLLLSLIQTSAFAENLAIGRWEQFDDQTGALQSIMRIEKEDENFVGYIEKRFELPNADEDAKDPFCSKCEGELKNKPKIGLKIMTGFKREGNEYSDGKILDANSGKIYSCKMTLSDGGNLLEVRGYFGISLFGRSQNWKRI